MVIDTNKFQFIEQLIFAEKFKSVAHSTLKAKSCVFAGQKMKRIAKLFLGALSFSLVSPRLKKKRTQDYFLRSFLWSC